MNTLQSISIIFIILDLKYIFAESEPKTDRVVKKYLTTAAYEEMMQIEQQIKKMHREQGL